MSKDVLMFKNEYEGFSNFSDDPVTYAGLRFETSEHLYHWFKARGERVESVLPLIQGLKHPGAVKKFGRWSLELRPGWKDIQIQVMNFIVDLKLTQHEKLQKLLASTGRARLVEGNYWHDNFWGDCFCKKCREIPGENHLGLIYIQKRIKCILIHREPPGYADLQKRLSNGIEAACDHFDVPEKVLTHWIIRYNLMEISSDGLF